MNSVLSSTARRLLAKVRPSSAGGDVPLRVLAGWYARKGALPLLRGLASAWRFKRATMPIFIGSGCRISYARMVELGRGCFLGANVVVQAYSVDGVRLGDRVTIRENGWIQCSSHPSNPGRGLEIGAGTYVGPNVTIGVGGAITIGAGCQIGANCTFIAENHAVGSDGAPSATEVVRRGISVGNGCWIGHGATVLDGVVLGDNCVVGAGAVVTRSFPSGSKLAGVPARLLL